MKELTSRQRTPSRGESVEVCKGPDRAIKFRAGGRGSHFGRILRHECSQMLAFSPQALCNRRAGLMFPTPRSLIADCMAFGSLKGGASFFRTCTVRSSVNLAEDCAAAPNLRLVNRDLNLAPQGAESSVELLEPSCMVQAKQPINRLALPVEAPRELSSGDILSREKTVELDL